MQLTKTRVAFAKAMMHKATGIRAVHFPPYMDMRHSGFDDTGTAEAHLADCGAAWLTIHQAFAGSNFR